MSGRKQANSKRTRSHAERVQTLGEKGFSLLEPDNFDEETKFLFGDNLPSEVKFLGDFKTNLLLSRIWPDSRRSTKPNLRTQR